MRRIKGESYFVIQCVNPTCKREALVKSVADFHWDGELTGGVVP